MTSENRIQKFISIFGGEQRKILVLNAPLWYLYHGVWHFPTQAHSYQQAGHILTRTTQIYATLAPRFHLVKWTSARQAGRGTMKINTYTQVRFVAGCPPVKCFLIGISCCSFKIVCSQTSKRIISSNFRIHVFKYKNRSVFKTRNKVRIVVDFCLGLSSIKSRNCRERGSHPDLRERSLNRICFMEWTCTNWNVWIIGLVRDIENWFWRRKNVKKQTDNQWIVIIHP